MSQWGCGKRIGRYFVRASPVRPGRCNSASLGVKEKYESGNDRKDAEKLLAARREEITYKGPGRPAREATAKCFRTQAESGRRLADSLRKL
jgi:hypothetical protein